MVETALRKHAMSPIAARHTCRRNEETTRYNSLAAKNPPCKRTTRLIGRLTQFMRSTVTPLRKRKQSKRLEAPEKVPFSKVSSTKDAALPRMPVVTRLHVGTGMGYLSTTYIIQNAAHMQVSMYLAPHHRRCRRRTLAEAGGLLACTATSYVQLCVHQTSFLSTVVCFFAGFLFFRGPRFVRRRSVQCTEYGTEQLFENK